MSAVVFVLLGLLSLKVSCYSLNHGRQRHVIKRVSSLGCPAAESLLEKVNLATPNSAIVETLCQYSSKMKICLEAKPDLMSPLPRVVNNWFFVDMPHLCGPWKGDAKKVGACIYGYLDKAEQVCSAEPYPNPVTLDSMIDRTAACYAKALSGCSNSSYLRDILHAFATFWFYNPFH